MRTNFDMVG